MISNSTDRSNKVDEIAAMNESNKAVMERLKRNEQPTPSGDYDEPGPAPMATLLVPGREGFDSWNFRKDVYMKIKAYSRDFNENITDQRIDKAKAHRKITVDN